MKTSVAEKVADAFSLTHISIQSLLANFIVENPGEEDAIEVRKKLASGLNPPDEITNALLATRLACKDAKDLGVAIVDYPRTEGQLAFLKNTLLIEPTIVIMLECSDNFIMTEQRFVDPVTGQHLTLQLAKTSGDLGLIHRISQLSEETKEFAVNSIEKWELTRRTLLKHFEQKTVSLWIEDKSEHQIIEQLSHILRKKV